MSPHVKEAFSNLDLDDNRAIVENYLEVSTEFENHLFSQTPTKKEAHLQGLITGILFAHPEYFDILSINESGGIGGTRPDIIFKDPNNKMTVIENKVAEAAQPLPLVAQNALDQTLINRYGDIVQKKTSQALCLRESF